VDDNGADDYRRRDVGEIQRAESNLVPSKTEFVRW
jgi:hypothetical protein